MNNEKTPKKLPRPETKRKLSLFIDETYEELYRIGKANGWDTPSIAKDAVIEALKLHSETLKKPAKSA
jgi:hypothetical protein